MHERCEGEVVHARLAEIETTNGTCWVDYEVNSERRRGLLRLEELYQRNQDQLRDPWALAEYLVTSDIRLVRAEFLWQLWRQQRSLPRRQEAEEEVVMCNGHQLSALVTHREVESWAESMATSTSTTFIWAVSHCWEMREHPDPFWHQLEHLVNFTSLQHVAYEAQQWLFYDYLSVFQFQRSSGHEEESFRLALKKMHMFYSHACTRTLRIESLTPENVREDMMKGEEDLLVFHGPSGHLAHVPLSQSRTVHQHPPCSSPSCGFLHLNLVPFTLRGWCRVESEWSTMRGASGASGTRRIDEGSERSVEMEEDGGHREKTDADPEFYNCKVAMPPEIFREQATSEMLRFTHRSDLKAVMKLQKRVFLEKAASCEALIQERLPDRELQILAAGLHHYKSLVSLTLRKCYFEDEGAKRLGEALDARLPLRQLRCSECRGGDVLAQAAALALRHCSLSQLVLAHDHISVKGAEALAEALQQSRLTELVLDHNQLGPRGAEALGKALRWNQTLIHLDLAHNFIGYKGAEEFSKSLRLNHTLQRLLLPFNNIKDKGAEALALALPSSLQHLDLTSNDLREAAAEVLAACLNHHLRRLDLGMNRLADGGAEALANALRGNECLTHLDLSHNDLQRPAGEALADALRVNTSLSHLDLARNELRQRGAEALIGALHENRTLRHLDLAENRVGFKVAEALAELHKLNEEVEVLLEYEATSVSGVSDADDGIGNAPVRCKALAADLRSGAMLSTLKLARDELSGGGIQVLADALSINSSVRSLCLEGAELGDFGIQVLAEGLKKNNSIRILNLRDNLIGDPGIKALAGALKRNGSIRLLKLEINEIGDEGIKALAVALKSNRALRTLFLGNNEIGDEGIKALAEALQENTSVNTLGIRGKNILRITSATAPLYLVHNELGDDAIKALAEALKVNRSVSQLYLGDHDIGDEGIKALEALKDEKLRQGQRLVLEY